MFVLQVFQVSIFVLQVFQVSIFVLQVFQVSLLFFFLSFFPQVVQVGIMLV